MVSLRTTVSMQTQIQPPVLFLLILFLYSCSITISWWVTVNIDKHAKYLDPMMPVLTVFFSLDLPKIAKIYMSISVCVVEIDQEKIKFLYYLKWVESFTTLRLKWSLRIQIGTSYNVKVGRYIKDHQDQLSHFISEETEF